jgi:hypothetical protein
MIPLPKTGLDCSKINDNHSEDRVNLYLGGGRPYQMCGYHTERLTQEQRKQLTEGEQE